MKKLTFSVLVTILLTSNVFAEELLNGFTLSAAQSTQNGVNNDSYGVSGLASIRPNSYYATEFQIGLLGKTGQFDRSILIDGAATGLLPMGKSGFNLFAKGGLAIIYSFEPNNMVYILSPTYGAGIEYKGKHKAIRLGYQHYDVGNISLSHPVSTHLIGISLLSIVQ
jgi:hypothetical protein